MEMLVKQPLDYVSIKILTANKFQCKTVCIHDFTSLGFLRTRLPFLSAVFQILRLKSDSIFRYRLATKARHPQYIAGIDMFQKQISRLLHIFGIMLLKRFTYFCVLIIIIDRIVHWCLNLRQGCLSLELVHKTH